MLLSALTLAAMLQVAPEVGLAGHLNEQRLSEAQPVGELTIPRKAKPAFVDRAPARSISWQDRKMSWRARKPTPQLGFVRGPQAAGCRKGLEQAGHPETLQVQPLSKMPRAHGELAVARLVDGCPVAVLIAQRAP
jgi:hypothetical protein